MLWDTAGQEEFDAITKAYYRGAQACVLTFSTVDRASFQAVRQWKKKVSTGWTGREGRRNDIQDEPRAVRGILDKLQKKKYIEMERRRCNVG